MDRQKLNSLQVLIWDLDGILINSYPTIATNLKNSLGELGLRYNGLEILNYIQEKSVYQFMERISFIYNIPFETIEQSYLLHTNRNVDSIMLYKESLEVLEFLRSKGVDLYLYTHRGESTYPILKKLGIIHYFTGIVTSEQGLCRKPHPDGLLYLKEKYALNDGQEIYYVGSKARDIEFAYYSRIKSILLSNKKYIEEDYGLQADYVITNIVDVKSILFE